MLAWGRARSGRDPRAASPVRVDGRVVPSAQRGDVTAPERVLVPLVERARRRRPARPGGALARCPRFHPARISTSSAFWTWRRFSDWSQMMLRGPSITDEVILLATMGGETVHRHGRGPGRVHQRIVDPVPAERVAAGLGLDLLAHRRPRVRVHDVGAVDDRGRVLAEDEAAAGRGGELTRRARRSAGSDRSRPGARV